MKEYEDMALKVGDRVGIEINKVDSGGIWSPSWIMLLYFCFRFDYRNLWG
jgi:hypothetical protein